MAIAEEIKGIAEKVISENGTEPGNYVDWEEDYNITLKEFDEALKLFIKKDISGYILTKEE